LALYAKLKSKIPDFGKTMGNYERARAIASKFDFWLFFGLSAKF